MVFRAFKPHIYQSFKFAALDRALQKRVVHITQKQFVKNKSVIDKMTEGTTDPKVNRGAFIVFEGCDRCGKSTQSNMLVDFLKSKEIPVRHMVFPARQSSIGQVINAYLTNKAEMSDQCIHLLFSANRWEFRNEIKKLLEAGITLVVDRYSYSGVVYSVAKGLDYDWCMAPEKGLIQPDVVFYLKTSINTLLSRGQFGEERYEKKEFQHKVSDVFNRICEQEQSYWHVIDASLSKEKIQEKIAIKALQLINDVNMSPLNVLR